MHQRIVSLSAASPSDHFQALSEVRDFATTDLGRGGPERWTYRVLPEPRLSMEVQRLAAPFSREGVDSISFQPCPLHEFTSQDRSLIDSWPMPGGMWTFTAVFDGHAGHSTVDHAVHTLPTMVKGSLESYLRFHRASFSPEAISKILSDAIVAFDRSMTTNFLDLFPGGPAAVQRMSDRQIRGVFEDRVAGGRNAALAVRCLQGSTALLTLTDPMRSHLWVANLGDSQAVLGARTPAGHWAPTFATAIHDGENAAELHRLRSEHPGERDCAEDNRVIGFLGPFRALGDTWLKVPAVYSQRVLLNFRREWNVERPEKYISRIRTPPYVSNVPDVQHVPLSPAAPGKRRDIFLVTCSDGLADLYPDLSRRDMINHWVMTVGRAVDSRTRVGNLASCLLRDALGGDDVRLVSQKLTVEIEEKWMDDVTILVQRF
ncbi:protein serine/threonine phosphatase 2C [Auriscalpium vulgare]|uniref:Protein serine/threonine phosphatase 2C n=1 Tax=Auriscalpium vulgare TaxID=40419 RepID=A0ACB8RH19_9AGAM|nr:protein serine/threonine phosphatase 2C [Auriscalpium vulgare]